MKIPMYKKYKSKKPIGVISLCNTFGILIFNPDDEDKYYCDLIAAWSNEEKIFGYHRHKIHYSTSGRAYIRKGSMRIYLDNVIKYK
ncbi:MAG: hypothetical protein IKW51_08685 [Bacteroidales bacterium]|nr:hypothetical protein [Bacteroidales bacterium]